MTFFHIFYQYSSFSGSEPNFNAGESQPLPITSTHAKCTDDKNTYKEESSVNSELEDTFSSLDLELIDSTESQHYSTVCKAYTAALPNESKRKKFSTLSLRSNLLLNAVMNFILLFDSKNELVSAIGFEKLIPKEGKNNTNDQQCDNMQNIPTATDVSIHPETEHRTQVSQKNATNEDKHVEIKCTVSVCGERNTNEYDDVIFVKECKGSVKLEVKIGASSGIPIHVTGDNSGINASNPIVID